ncbi:hypothetical protein ACN27E_09075 [Mycobacterium sp. WMMD1722]|uniref:hypothetical protein n=1 Tax=Mycobacterium sp. WMMD1722 TaxID=3404117 RepID=UPI003BF6037D
MAGRLAHLSVRDVLKLGAASVGMGAALLGWSLVGSDIGVAGADSGVESSSAGPAAPSSRGVDAGPRGVDAGSRVTSTPGRTRTAASRADADADGRTTTSRRANRTATDEADLRSRGAAHSDRAVSAASSFTGTRSSSTGTRSNTATSVDSPPAVRAATPSSTPLRAAQTAAAAPPASTPPARVVSRSNRVAAVESSSATDKVAERTNGEAVESLQDSGPLPVVTAGVRDGLGAAAKLLAQAVKDALSSRPLQNTLQGQGPKLPGLLDLIPKTRYTVNDPLRNAIRQAQEADAQRQQDAKSRQINDIIQKGTKLTAADGWPVYTTDGRTFVRYASSGSTVYGNVVTEHPRQAQLVTIRRGNPAPWQSAAAYDRRFDNDIRNYLKLDPAVVRRLLEKR